MKIILTEEQFDKLGLYLVETKFDTFIKDSAKVGDIIRIHYKNTTSSFKVLNNDMGQITMDCIDAGVNKNYRFFLAYTGLSGNKLQLSKVHKIKEKDKLDDVKSWKTENLNDVKNIELVRGDKVVDTVDKPKGVEPDNANGVGDFESEITHTLAYLLSELKEGKGLVMKMTNNEELLYCCLARDSKTFTLELKSKTNLKELTKWDSFLITLNGNPDNEDENLYELNKEKVRTKDGGKSFDILTKALSGNVTKNIWITGILGFSVTPNCESTEEENPDNTKQEKGDDTFKQKKDAKKVMDAIINDPLMKRAFYKQPSLLNFIISAIRGKNPKGTGILPAKQIITNYKTSKIKDALGELFENFRTNRPLEYKLLSEPITFKSTNNGEPIVYEMNHTYGAKVKEVEVDNNYLTLIDEGNNVTIQIKGKNESSRKPNAFNVTFQKVYTDEKTKKSETKSYNAFVQMISKEGSGYYDTIKKVTK
jgi:hypothetical protein